MKKSNITVIVPVHTLTEKTKPMFSIAVQSIAQQTLLPDEVLIVTPSKSDTLEYLKSFDFKDIKDIVKIVENDGDTDFCNQFNLGVTEAKSDFVSLLEYDDEYSKIWFKNAVKYMEAYPDVDVFLPIIADVDGNGQFIGTTNEAVWAYRFSDEMGFLDSNALLAYQNFNIDGMVIRKSLFDEFGGFKSSIKLTFIYEFLLRMVHNDAKVMTIPRFGYKHVNMRENSLFHTYSQEMDAVESKWWLDKAKKEFYFTKQRDITYEK